MAFKSILDPKLMLYVQRKAKAANAPPEGHRTWLI